MDRTIYKDIYFEGVTGLNPYSNGIWIEQYMDPQSNLHGQVLILILMEYG